MGARVGAGLVVETRVGAGGVTCPERYPATHPRTKVGEKFANVVENCVAKSSPPRNINRASRTWRGGQ